MKRYRIVAVFVDGSQQEYGGPEGYQNVFVADGAAKMLLHTNPTVDRVYFQCLDA